MKQVFKLLFVIVSIICISYTFYSFVLTDKEEEQRKIDNYAKERQFFKDKTAGWGKYSNAPDVDSNPYIKQGKL
jgi:sortase (surface protein transpeptidase)